MLAEKLDVRHIELSVYAKEKGFILEDDSERDTLVVDMDAISMSLSELIKVEKRTVIIDGHYSHEILDNEQIDIICLLRKAPWILHDILQNRLYSYDKVWENLEAEIMGVIADELMEYPLEKLHEIDTTEMSPEETVTEIMAVINGEKPMSFGPIDWITYPETLRVLVNRTCTLS